MQLQKQLQRRNKEVGCQEGQRKDTVKEETVGRKTVTAA